MKRKVKAKGAERAGGERATEVPDEPDVIERAQPVRSDIERVDEHKAGSVETALPAVPAGDVGAFVESPADVLGDG